MNFVIHWGFPLLTFSLRSLPSRAALKTTLRNSMLIDMGTPNYENDCSIKCPVTTLLTFAKKLVAFPTEATLFALKAGFRTSILGLQTKL